MAEQKITVRLDPRDVADLKQFVREELRKERRDDIPFASRAPGGPVTWLGCSRREATGDCPDHPVIAAPVPRPNADPMPEELHRIRLELASFALWCEQRMDSEVVRTDIAPRLRNIQHGEPWRDL